MLWNYLTRMFRSKTPVHQPSVIERLTRIRDEDRDAYLRRLEAKDAARKPEKDPEAVDYDLPTTQPPGVDDTTDYVPPATIPFGSHFIYANNRPVTYDPPVPPAPETYPS